MLVCWEGKEHSQEMVIFGNAEGVAAAPVSQRKQIQLPWLQSQSSGDIPETEQFQEEKLQIQSSGDIPEIGQFQEEKSLQNFTLQKVGVITKNIRKFQERFCALIEFIIISGYCDTKVFLLKAWISAEIIALEPCSSLSLHQTNSLDLFVHEPGTMLYWRK